MSGVGVQLGIGRATALQFAHNGVKALFLCDVISTHLESLKLELAQLSPNALAHVRKFDAADEAAVEAVVHEAVEMYGRLDVFFANAGIPGGVKLLGDIVAEEFMNTMRVNALSVILAVKHAAAGMKVTGPEKPASGGSIIATASAAGVRSGASPSMTNLTPPFPALPSAHQSQWLGLADYSASKAAVINVMQTSAFQLAGTNIRCNAVCPGLTETGMTSAFWEDARKRGTEGEIGRINPLGRGAVSDEIARVALFLASDEYAYTG